MKSQLRDFFNRQYEAKLRPREQQTADEAELATEVLAETLVNLIIDASRPVAGE